uniref:c-SKI SMAD4-binding domain-containing protein n=1 Tax=Stomoxys calcitrans TaxID=35570 RepID=A0A1I8PHJ2_STOCA
MTEYVTPNIHTVLKKYQTSAPKSLQGPGHSLANINSTASSGNNNGNTLPSSSSSAAAAIPLPLVAGTAHSAHVGHVNAAVDVPSGLCASAAVHCPLDVSLANNGGGVANLSTTADNHGLVAMRTSPCDLVKAAPSNASAVGLTKLSQASNSNPTTTVPSSSAHLSTAATNPALPLIKKEIMTSPEPAPPPHDLRNEGPCGPPTAAPSAPPSIKIMPPPPPEVSQPILSAADTGSGELYETRLEGKTIGCFSMGGEMRLCLPQFLNNVLAEFSLEQINHSFDDLGIFCSQCTPEQLLEFKAAKILPSDVKSSGLITRTDAERLCAILLHRSDRNSYINVEDIPKGAISFKVYHRCFGKCEGICTPDMYSYQKPTCIMCLECRGWFSPQKFVGHVHREVENRTCHWGFDSRNWHDYLHVALDVENREKYQKTLDELKEVEIKEQQKALQEINYLKRKVCEIYCGEIPFLKRFLHYGVCQRFPV